jgi:phosphoribosylformimino-5-aminoimidazole carboxamide ribotide isomerase
MLIIPAVDIKDGKCVRLEQGKMERETIFSEHPEQMAIQWERKGAKKIHIVDLDGAVSGRPVNTKIIQRITESISIPVELGGGIRSLDAIEEYISLGIADVIVGSAAYNYPDLVRKACKRFPGRIIVGIDARDGRVAVQGWTESTGVSAIDLAKVFEGVGVTALIYTDIARDGMKSGPNIESIRSFASATALPVIAAGGVSSLKDIEELLLLQADGVSGIIIGRALYDGSIELDKAIEMIEKKGFLRVHQI